MRYEGKTEADAIETALKRSDVPVSELSYRVVRDEKSFWGGRVVEIEIEVAGSAELPHARARARPLPTAAERAESPGRRARLDAAAGRGAADRGEAAAAPRGRWTKRRLPRSRRR